MSDAPLEADDPGPCCEHGWGCFVQLTHTDLRVDRIKAARTLVAAAARLLADEARSSRPLAIVRTHLDTARLWMEEAL